MQRPLLSIVIPTKNRYCYLKYFVEYFVSLDDARLELVIQDNSDDNSEILNYLSEYQNKANVIYNYTKEWLSVVDNSDKAILNSTGEYICFIGDDDGIDHKLIDIVEYMRSNNIDSMTCTKPVFCWPDIKSKGLNLSGIVTIRSRITNIITKIQPKLELQKSLNKGGISLENMPCVYQGVVRRKTLDLIFDRTSSFFPGPSPDMANAVALSLVVNNAIYVNSPLIISGQGFKSAAGLGARKAHISKIEDVVFLPKNTIASWESFIPKYWTGETIYAESTTKALRRMGFCDLLNNLNKEYLYAAIVMFHRGMFITVMPFISIKGIFRFLYSYCCIFSNRAMVFIFNRLNIRLLKIGYYHKYAADDIISCIAKTTNLIQ